MSIEFHASLVYGISELTCLLLSRSPQIPFDPFTLYTNEVLYIFLRIFNQTFTNDLLGKRFLMHMLPGKQLSCSVS